MSEPLTNGGRNRGSRDEAPTGRFTGHRALVVGYGASGRAAAKVLVSEGAEVRVSEARAVEELGPVDPRVTLLAGGHREEHLHGATIMVVSPGVPEWAPIIGWARRRGLPVWSELELGARLCTVPVIGVTGTNGKTTTVELLAAMLRQSGLTARACGNVGYPFSLAAVEPFQALAVEASSFQLRFQESFHPRVSVLLNVAPDHLDWHGSFVAYAEAKARIYASQGPEDVHVGNREEGLGAEISRRAPCPVAWFRGGPPEAGEVGVVEGRVVSRQADTLDLGRPAGAGRSLLIDSAAAAAAALAFGLAPEAVRSALQSFHPLEHRGSVVAEAGSVRFIDDSKATNPHATLAALEGRSESVLIAGGLAKGVDLSPLAQAAPNLAAVVTIGEAASALEAVFDDLVVVRRAGSIEEAVEFALEEAHPGHDILLAPACASQDMFHDYRERGERFAAAARDLAAQAATEGEASPAGPDVPPAGPGASTHATTDTLRSGGEAIRV
jgi:UDP-N-acetylmuramoylalanine--D-glutamate ligase